MFDQPHASATSTLGKDPQHPLNRRQDAPQGWSDVLDRKSLASARNKPHTVQHQDYHYTD